jgi:hypothetical protein
MKKFFWILFFVALIVIQFIPVQRTNPAIFSDIDAPAEIKAIFQRSCYDCHSNETNWPWYSYVAPTSWIMIGHVNEGRENLNFSTWGTLDRSKQAKLREKIWEEIREEQMPLWQYRIMHPGSKLSQEDKNRVRNWAGE